MSAGLEKKQSCIKYMKIQLQLYIDILIQLNTQFSKEKQGSGYNVVGGCNDGV